MPATRRELRKHLSFVGSVLTMCKVMSVSARVVSHRLLSGRGQCQWQTGQQSITATLLCPERADWLSHELAPSVSGWRAWPDLEVSKKHTSRNPGGRWEGDDERFMPRQFHFITRRSAHHDHGGVTKQPSLNDLYF